MSDPDPHEFWRRSASCRLTSASERDVSEAMACERDGVVECECVVGPLFVGLSWVCSARACVLSWVFIEYFFWVKRVLRYYLGDRTAGPSATLSC